MLQVEALNQFYGSSHTLWDVGIQAREGACTCIMGRNGVGKTTLLKTVMGLVPAKSGSIRYGESELTSKPPSSRAKLGIGYVPQGREIFPLLSVEENLRIGLTATGAKSTQVPESIFELFPVLKKMLARKGGNLSGGQQQQLAIGRALALDPSLLILDEPTEGIQPNIVREIGDIIVRVIQERKLAVLLVVQNLLFARKVGDYFYIMDKGRVMAEGQMNQLDDNLVNRHLKV